jgi:hypothetical protein
MKYWGVFFIICDKIGVDYNYLIVIGVLLTTTNKDFKVKHGLVVANGATFGQPIEIGEPTADDHAATKGYVDEALSSAVGIVDPVLVATTENINISTDTLVGEVIDGLTLQAGSRILIKDQTNPVENGIYNVNSSGPATRSLDFSSSDEFYTGSRIYVSFGQVNEQTSWVVSSYENDIDVDPITFKFLGPFSLGEGLSVIDNQIELDDTLLAKVFVDGDVTGLSLDITKSALTIVGELESLAVDGQANFSDNVEIAGNLDVLATADFQADVEILGDLLVSGPLVQISQQLEVSGDSIFSGAVQVPEPTLASHAATKDYVDNLLDQEQVEITTIDDLSNYFNGFESRFKPTYQGVPVTLQNPFNLLLSIDGIIQSVGSPDYVWQSVMPRVGFRIDNDGYIAFPEVIPPGSSFDARVLVGSSTTQQTKIYPFKAMDIVLGGY